MIYLRAGLYAEGPTDYYFLMPLLERLLWEIGMKVLPEPPEVAAPLALDAPPGIPKGREQAIPAAIEASWEECTLYVIHSDGDGDPEQMRRTCCQPAIEAARARYPEVAIAACIPVRELEAWMLADGDVFRKLRRGRAEPELPKNPEAELDPKKILRRVVAEMGIKQIDDLYAFIGGAVSAQALRRLPAFQHFEAELADAIRNVGRLQHRPT